MPAYGTLQSGGVLTSLSPGDGPVFLFNAEVVVTGEASIAIAAAMQGAGGSARGIVFTTSFAVAPTAEVHIQASNVDQDGQYQDLPGGELVNIQEGFYADQGLFAYYRAKVISYVAGGALTVTAKAG